MLLSETTEYNDDDAELKVKAFKALIKPSSKFTVKKEGFADMLYVTSKDAIKFKEDKTLWHFKIFSNRIRNNTK